MNAMQDDIRRLLRGFGIQADETIQAQAKNAAGVEKLRLRLVVEDLTDYGGTHSASPPRILEVEGEITV